MTVNSDATVMNPRKGEQGRQVGPLPSPRRTPAQSWSRRCPFWLLSRRLRNRERRWERSGLRAGRARLPAAGPLGGAPEPAGYGKLSSFAARLSGSYRLPPAACGTGPSSPRPSTGATPSTGSRRAAARPPPPSRALSGSPRRRELPSTSKSRPEPVVIAVQQLVEDPSDVFRVEVPPVALRPQRLLHAVRRGESRRQPARGARAAVPSPQPSRQTRACGGTGPRGRAEAGRGPGRSSPAPQGGLRAPLGVGGVGAGTGRAHSPHGDAQPGDEQSHASGMCEDAQVPSDPSTGASAGAHPSLLPSPLGRAPAGWGYRRVRRAHPLRRGPGPASARGGEAGGACGRVCPSDPPPPFSFIWRFQGGN